ncbi:MAG: helix-turn-helix transcriptional regulator [Firmicutes bacterium]|nr:helix-turn-helix transcriptional regulator [Bacillota bacterium]
MELNARQKEILEIVKNDGPISAEEIASRLSISKAAIRPHLASLTLSGFLAARPRVGYYYVGKDRNALIADIFREIKVKDIKSVPVVIREESSVYDAIVTLFLEDVGTIYVVDDQAILQGVISRKDLLKVSMGNNDLSKMPVGVVMTRMPNIVTVEPEENVLEMASKIIEYEVDSLPVVRPLKDDALEVIGRVTKTNLTRLIVEIAGWG